MAETCAGLASAQFSACPPQISSSTGQCLNKGKKREQVTGVQISLSWGIHRQDRLGPDTCKHTHFPTSAPSVLGLSAKLRLWLPISSSAAAPSWGGNWLGFLFQWLPFCRLKEYLSESHNLHALLQSTAAAFESTSGGRGPPGAGEAICTATERNTELPPLKEKGHALDCSVTDRPQQGQEETQTLTFSFGLAMLPSIEVEQLFAGPFLLLLLQHSQAGSFCPGQARLAALARHLHPALRVRNALLLGCLGFFL